MQRRHSGAGLLGAFGYNVKNPPHMSHPNFEAWTE